MNQPTPQDLHEARLTAYALDELTADERAQVERLLAAGTPEAAAATREIARIREAGSLLMRELARELGDGPAPALTPAQRAAISRAARPARPRPILRWSLAAACAALAAVVMVAILVPGGAPMGDAVAIHAPRHAPEDAPEPVGRSRAPAVSPNRGEAGGAERGRQAGGAAGWTPLNPGRGRGGGTGDELANKREGTVAANAPARKQERELKDAIAPGPAAASPAPAMAADKAASGDAPARAPVAAERQKRVLADAAPAPLAAIPPAAPPPLTAPAAAAPVAAAPAESALTAARRQQEEKAIAADGLAEPSALGGPAASAPAAGSPAWEDAAATSPAGLSTVLAVEPALAVAGPRALCAQWCGG